MTLPVRVLTVIRDVGFGGAENRILTFARHLDPSRVSLRIATLHAPDAEVTALAGTLRNEFSASKITVESLGAPRPRAVSRWRPLQVLYTAYCHVRVALSLAAAARHVDIVDAHLEAALLAAVGARLLTGTPVLATLYYALPAGAFGSYPRLWRWLLRRTSSVITDSAHCAADLRACVGDRGPLVTVVPNGVSLPPPSQSPAEVRTLLALDADDGPIIGQVAGFQPTKGQRTLIRALPSLLAVHPRLRCVCVGFPRAGHAYVQSLRDEATALGVSHALRLVSYAGPIADIWQVLDVHVHPTDLDSLPNAIIEGMSLRKPAVVTNVGGITELVTDRITGRVVPAGDPSRLAQALLDVLGNPETARRYGEAARARYSERCAPSVTTRALEALFLQAAARDAFPTRQHP
jgi:glycosyltransferase involved in cell wall biosynthesis